MGTKAKNDLSLQAPRFVWPDPPISFVTMAKTAQGLLGIEAVVERDGAVLFDERHPTVMEREEVRQQA